MATIRTYAQRLLSIGGLLLFLAPQPGWGQESLEPFFILSTQGSSDALISASSSVGLPGAGQPGVLTFAFGFTTDEANSSGKLLDSFTISVADAAVPSATTIFLTVDTSGLVLAPPTPGTIPINSSALTLSPLAFPGSLPVLANRLSYLVTARVPDQLADKQLNVHFDLFNNVDGSDSLGWASKVTVVPEPQTAAWVLLGVGVWIVRRRMASR